MTEQWGWRYTDSKVANSNGPFESREKAIANAYEDFRYSSALLEVEILVGQKITIQLAVPVEEKEKK